MVKTIEQEELGEGRLATIGYRAGGEQQVMTRTPSILMAGEKFSISTLSVCFLIYCSHLLSVFIPSEFPYSFLRRDFISRSLSVSRANRVSR